MKSIQFKYLKTFSVTVLVMGLALTSCKNSPVSSSEEKEEIAPSIEMMSDPGFAADGNTTTNVFKSGTHVRTYDVILPPEPGYNHDENDPNSWQNAVCKEDGSGSIGLNAGWNRVEGQTAYEVGTHTWESNSDYSWDAAWINAVNTMQSLETYSGFIPGNYDPEKSGPEKGQNWTRYDMDIKGIPNETYKLQLLADNCSWIYLDGQMVGYQDDSDVGKGPIEYGVTTNGQDQVLTFIIWDGNGLAGGKFRMETTFEEIPTLDQEVPSLSINTTQNENFLWPPNHKMVHVATATVEDNFDSNPNLEVSVTINDVEGGDGNTKSDYELVDKGDGSFDIYVRAERSGKGNGRTYSIDLTASDYSGNTIEDSFSVSVGHNRGGKKGN